MNLPRSIAILTVAAATLGWAQQAQRVMGVITSVDPAAKQISVKTDQGDVYAVGVPEAARIVKTAPGAKDLKDAKPVKLDEVAAGDRVIATGLLDASVKTLEAQRVIVMSKAEIVKKQERDKAEWTRRGWSGRVASFKPDSVKLLLPGAPGAQSAPKEVLVKLTDKTVVRRYAPDSIRFADAKVGTLAEMTKDDQVRVIGEKNAEGTEMVAEELVYGTFRNTAAVVVAIDAEAGTITAKNWETNKPVTIKTTADSQLKKLPAFMSGGGAGGGGQRPGMGGGAAPGGGTTQRPAGGGFQGGPGAAGGPGGNGGGMRPGGGGGRGGMDLSAMLERMPAIKVTDLKVGDQLVVSHTKGAKSDEITAITMLAGVEGILQSIQAQNAARGPSMGGGGAAGGGGGMDLGFPSMVP